MIYQLVLITNLGVITPLATFPDRLDCIREQGYIQKSQQYSATCLPANSPEQASAQAQQGFKIMLEMMERMKQEMK
jgi:hypothetical protein